MVPCTRYAGKVLTRFAVAYPARRAISTRHNIPTGKGIPPPLRGVRVLDLTRVLAGPTSTMLLADLGADVVKVEEVARGDDTRSWSPPSAPMSNVAPQEAAHLPAESAYFLAVNRNKRSITVNFKDPEGLEIIYKLIKSSDVLVENFVAGKLASMGLGWDDCKKLNPQLVYASITGKYLSPLWNRYGQTGPYRQAAGYDVVIEAEAGLMHITGEPDRAPAKVGVAVTDIMTGLYAHGAIMAALRSVQQTGEGVWIDCNLFESQLAGLANIASNYLIAGREASRHGTAHPSIVPYQVFPCKDGYLMIGAGNDKQFRLLSQTILGKPELADDRRFSNNAARVANRIELVEIISNVLKERSREYWIERFTGLGVPFGPINNIRQTFEHPQAIARESTVEVDHPRAGKIRMVAPPVTYNGRRMPVRYPPPWLSQHTYESSDTDVIDMETFQQILELDDDDLEFSRDMAYAYFTQAETTFDQMEKAFKGDDLHELGSLGHFLKGSSAALGVSKVQATCEKIQHYGQMKDDETEKPLTKPAALAKIEPLLSSVKIEYAAAKKWLETYYATRTPGETT
ncbi:Hpt, histidine phosphotransferase protein [Leucogyrophana mollusca]|uniref:Hpt, histidine phosphotransferase protein n=1 Tax=Leucogyrophana mollusca TaxID=85980 RepID=A0ACB8BLJ6_9AGAM|nr:Hpt, histidine phosphotransferase protein [Leucogyrophana mollusca]